MDFSRALQPALQLLKPIADEFTEAGYRLYLVGGIVRDLAFGLPGDMADLDLTTDARPAFISDVLKSHASVLWTQGERFGTIGAQVGGKAVEITTHRSETYVVDTRKPEVNFGDSLDVDLSRRDFTINAMAISIPDAEFFDPFGGLSHLKQRVLATPIDPTVSFSDDPLRMLRAARFLARFDLAPDPGLGLAAADLASRLDVVSRERISAELDRLFEIPEPRSGFTFLLDAGLLQWAIPQMGTCSENDLIVATSLASSPGNLDVRRAGLLYRLSKDRIRQALAQLRYSVDVQRRSKRLLEELDLVLTPAASVQAVRQLVVNLDLSLSSGRPCQQVVDLRQLAENISTLIPSVEYDGSFFEVLDGALAEGEVLRYRSALSGHEIMELLDAAAGPIVGQAKSKLRDHWIQTGSHSADDARDLLSSWDRGQSSN